MKSNASLFYSLVLVVGDFLALVAAFVAAYILRVSINFTDTPITDPVNATTYLEIFTILLPFWILIFALLGLYDNFIYEKRFAEAGRLFIGSFIGLLFVIGFAYFDNRQIFPAHLVPALGFGLAFIFLVTFRNSARLVRKTLFTRDIGITNLLIVGNTKIALELVRSLNNNPASGYRIVGVVGNKAKISKRFPHLALFDDFQDAIAGLHTANIHAIIQTELYASQEQNNAVLEFSQTHHIAYRFIPGNSELFVGNIAVELFQGSIPVIAVHQTALIGWGRIVKRISDLIFGGLLLLLATPFMLLIALLLKIFEPTSPIFYKDLRLSRFGTTIKIYKFRSLKKAYNNMSPEDGFTKMGKPELIRRYRENGDYLDNDPRITPVGRFLRKTSLDELPQFINVIKGDISLVGPRALQHSEMEQYAKKDMILSIKSGLTGLAQVSGRRDISVEERRKLDLYYVQNWSFWLDLTIIAKTVRFVLGHIGAK